MYSFPEGRASNLPADGWSLPNAKIISGLKYINMPAAKSLITNADEDASNRTSVASSSGAILGVMIRKQRLESGVSFGSPPFS